MAHAGGRPSIWNSYAPICRYVAQIVVEVAVNVAADLYSIGEEASFSKSQALGASSGVDCVAVLALGVLAKLDATIQLCRSRSGASAAGKGHIIKEFN